MLYQWWGLRIGPRGKFKMGIVNVMDLSSNFPQACTDRSIERSSVYEVCSALSSAWPNHSYCTAAGSSGYAAAHKHLWVFGNLESMDESVLYHINIILPRAAADPRWFLSYRI